MDIQQQLKRFERRVRLMRGWKGLAVGASLAAAVSLVWAVLDWVNLAPASALDLGLVVAAGALIGVVVGFLQPVPAKTLGDSIDRRARLNNRLGTALEGNPADDAFAEPQRADAQAKLGGIRAKDLFPFRFGRPQFAAVTLSALVAAVFLLGNTPLLLSAEQKQARKEMKAESSRVEKVRRENLENPKDAPGMSEEEKRLADEMRRLERDLERAKMSPEEAMQKANKIASEAEKLSLKANEDAQKQLATASEAMEQMKAEALKQAGLPQMPSGMAEMTPEQRKNAQKENQKRQNDLKAQMAALEKRLAEIKERLKSDKLSKAERDQLEKERAALEAQKKALESQLAAAKKDEMMLKLSAEAQAVFEKMAKSPLYQELMKLQAKLQANANAMANGQKPTLTPEERRKMLAALEAFAKEMKDQKAMEAYLKAMIEALKNAKKAGNCKGVGLGIRPTMPGIGGPSNDIWAGDNKKINKLDKGVAGGGKTFTTQVTGSKRPTGESDPYIEFKAPTMVGNRSSIPYAKVLPSYKKRAESALNRQEIPKEYQGRVKEYFKSLGQ
jgi:hypothetical protein